MADVASRTSDADLNSHAPVTPLYFAAKQAARAPVGDFNRWRSVFLTLLSFARCDGGIAIGDTRVEMDRNYADQIEVINRDLNMARERIASQKAAVVDALRAAPTLIPVTAAICASFLFPPAVNRASMPRV